jgi:hypothetical protein
MKSSIGVGVGLSVLVCLSLVAKGLVSTESHGRWPASWPQALEPLRDHARTIGVANGTQEDIYEITFAGRAEFEKAWPSLLALKTPGAPLRLYRVGSTPAAGLDQLESDVAPTVRIYAPPPCEVVGPDGQMLRPSAPWPKEITGPNGELPEFVHDEIRGGKLAWAAGESKGFNYRARIDIDLVVDGQVIDLNRIALPHDTPIVDHRF